MPHCAPTNSPLTHQIVARSQYVLRTVMNSGVLCIAISADRQHLYASMQEDYGKQV
ncbi:hypothetical protein [Dickeya sp. CFBP 2040]|uniref:hypothetical protein n=1 Tax=Dickeya sp. CFBP 2040 TaxID=2718531 RepID=UPI001446F9CF|nr:hypothetical protein [Dickeya sp. CFBP 2040]